MFVTLSCNAEYRQENASYDITVSWELHSLLAAAMSNYSVLLFALNPAKRNVFVRIAGDEEVQVRKYIMARKYSAKCVRLPCNNCIVCACFEEYDSEVRILFLCIPNSFS